MDKDRAQKLADFYQAVADGKTLQHKRSASIAEEMTWQDVTHGPIATSCLEFWRVKPELKPIDLSVLIKSGIDCEFSESNTTGVRYIGKLCSAGADYSRALTNNRFDTWACCRPRMNHLHAWAGGNCPLPEGLEVEVTFRDRSPITARTGPEFRWDHRGTSYDIIAFEVLGLQDGYCWPWECV